MTKQIESTATHQLSDNMRSVGSTTKKKPTPGFQTEGRHDLPLSYRALLKIHPEHEQPKWHTLTPVRHLGVFHVDPLPEPAET